MIELTAVLQRKRSQIEKLMREIQTLEAAEALLASENESAAPPRPQAMSAVASATTDKSERVATRFP